MDPGSYNVLQLAAVPVVSVSWKKRLRAVSSSVSQSEPLLLVDMQPPYRQFRYRRCDTASDWLVASRGAGLVTEA